MKHKLFCLLLAVLLLFPAFFVPVLAEECAYSELATTQSFYSLVAYTRMCKGLSPFYVLDRVGEQGEKNRKIGSVDRVQSLIDGILAFQTKNHTVQEWIDTFLSEHPDAGAEWYVMALSQSGDYHFKNYEKALLNVLKEKMPANVPTAQKLALALLAAGSQDSVVKEIANRPIDSAPLSAKIFGLHLLNNGIQSTAYTADSVIAQLLAAQFSDGGWAIMGQYGDVDMTAMVLQALAPHYEKPVVKAAVDRAVAFLSARQNADGSFTSMGKVNCESTAQVITALSSLRIDSGCDARFLKNGKSVIDGLRKFLRADGSFSHLAPQEISASEETKPAEVSQITPPSDRTESSSEQKNTSSASAKAESQAFSSSESAEKSKKESSLKAITEQQAAIRQEQESEKAETIVSDNQKQETVSEQWETEAENDKKQTKETEKREEKTQKRIGYKPVIAVVLVILAACAAAILIVCKKATRKNFLLLCLLLAASLIFVLATNFESTTAHNSVQAKSDVIGTVTLSIRCDTVAGKGDPEFIPTDGCILKETEFAIEKGDTVYDVLEEATKRFSIHMEKKGTEGFVYVAAIGHLYELQFGEMSGWVYHVNGESPFIGCDSFSVSDGDHIEWMYTLDLGADVGNTFAEKEGKS